MAERPFSFSSTEVTAIIAGRKTQVRRVIRPRNSWSERYIKAKSHEMPMSFCPYGVPGDRLWAREAWASTDQIGVHRFDAEIVYRADGQPWDSEYQGWRWKPGHYMPRAYSRITLEVVSVRVERLGDITGRDVLAEGVDNGKSNPTMGERWENMQRMAFTELWESINGKGSWAANPLVWVVEFKKLEARDGVSRG